MERMFRINWPAVVEEAKQRRKEQKLTQKRLARLAGISTPTISRFESGSEDITVSSVTAILGVLGMLDRRALNFPDPRPYYDARRSVVLFDGTDGGAAVQCAISREALEDHFGRDDRDPVKVYHEGRERIEHEARRKYLSGRLESDQSVLIQTTDL
jgi:transcriptional regulator with XRE-family HTH domain